MPNFDKEFTILLDIYHSLVYVTKEIRNIAAESEMTRDFIVNLCIFKMYIFSSCYIFCTIEIIA